MDAQDSPVAIKALQVSMLSPYSTNIQHTTYKTKLHSNTYSTNRIYAKLH